MARLYVAAQVYREVTALPNVSYRHGWMRRAKLGNREGGIGTALFGFRLFSRIGTYNKEIKMPERSRPMMTT